MTATTLDETMPAETGIPVLRPGTDEYDTAPRVVECDDRPSPAADRAAAKHGGGVDCRASRSRNNLPTAVQGGGHSTPGSSMCDDDGIVMDLARLNQANVDPATKRAYLQGGALAVRTRRCDRSTRA